MISPRTAFCSLHERYTPSVISSLQGGLTTAHIWHHTHVCIYAPTYVPARRTSSLLSESMNASRSPGAVIDGGGRKSSASDSLTCLAKYLSWSPSLCKERVSGPEYALVTCSQEGERGAWWATGHEEMSHKRMACQWHATETLSY